MSMMLSTTKTSEFWRVSFWVCELPLRWKHPPNPMYLAGTSDHNQYGRQYLGIKSRKFKIFHSSICCVGTAHFLKLCSTFHQAGFGRCSHLFPLLENWSRDGKSLESM